MLVNQADNLTGFQKPDTDVSAIYEQSIRNH